jgi:nuclear transport factor 2 (NTF2) superfamily protein
MKSDGTGDSLLFDHGVDTLKLAGDHIYFHNLNDSYAVKRSDGSEEEWLEGRLYRMSIETGQSNAVRTEYDWDYFPADAGLVVFTEGKLELESFYGLGSTILYAPEDYTDMALIDNSMLLYEYDSKRLVRVWLSNLPHTVIFEDPVFPGAGNEEGRTTDENGEVEGEPTAAPSETDSSWAATTAPTPRPTSNAVSTPKPTATPKPGDNTYIFPKSNTQKLTRSDIEKVKSSLWAYGRNEILARHGYQFKTKKYADYFAKKAWYHPGGYSSSKVSSTEWYNMELLKEMEAEQTGIDNGDDDNNETDSSYIFPNSNKKKLTKSEIREVDKNLWSYGRNEILARHGYKFKTKKYADYFATKSWYKPGGYNEKNVSSVEWYNMELLKEMEDGG